VRISVIGAAAGALLLGMFAGLLGRPRVRRGRRARG
jgi:hypothetical protein